MDPYSGGSWTMIPTHNSTPTQSNQDALFSLASHFHLLQLVENLAEVVEHGTRDQQSDALVNDLSSHFEKCQQLLNSISVSLSSKAMTVEGQKKKLEESEQLLSQRRDLFAKYRNSVEELIKSEP
ncbi:Mediator of RNA polymerase II transcription subunit 9 [Quillaja saponaria]|uniref:Mediator of RNA polymerase II transcription subunit 9 n=1 Tax=Quillaja saponaria TaxID=32244 RepID=A0AAD7PQJ0_QUISA|nr:Mediator of RNA polymerase II transcription subunit 9 [Quillaja saponaria]